VNNEKVVFLRLNLKHRNMTDLLEIEDITAVDTVKFVRNYKISASKNDIKADPLAEFFGMWADRDIDAATLRKQAWGIED
jgi:hypothetical protein